MGMNIDRDGRRTPREAVGVVDASGGAAIAILAIDHCIDLVEVIVKG
jgi:hypothetical protein